MAKSAEHELKDVSETAPPVQRLSDWRMLVLMPAIGMFLVASPYAAVPLHYTLQGWALWRQGVLQLLGYSLRNCWSFLFARVGPWAAPLCCLTAFLLVLPACFWPDVEWIVSLQLLGCWGTNLELAWQAVAFEKYSQSSSLLKRASRIHVLTATTGYATAAFISGLLYDFLGGWHACAILQAVCFGYMTLTFATHDRIRHDWHRYRAQRRGEEQQMQGATAGASAPPAELKEEGSEKNAPAAQEELESSPLSRAMYSPATAPQIKLGAGDGVENTVSTSSLPKPQSAPLWKVLTLPTFATLLAHFACQYAYNCEWATFALYFKEQHHWNNAFLAGFMQMIGDIIGGILLVLLSPSTTEAQKTDAECEKTGATKAKPQRKRALFMNAIVGQPYNITWLLLGWIATTLGLTSSSLFVAVCSQVLMGAVYVFFQ
eukprot:TRINITY_DN51092_c0_g1_i1.p1 TRINITY_DN51092_c0_g1~~TRINITY_DN51092_c0_g1_i1.p1  ORF type:complete len:431 (-),score=63.23 TRINITY_DN51092_c0_g1_i1:611-1903(-)